MTLYRRLRALLDGVPAPELEGLRGKIAGLERWLSEVARGLEEFARFKRARGVTPVFSRGESGRAQRPTPGRPLLRRRR